MNISNREYNYPVSDLLKTIRDNHEEHIRRFQVARAAYRAEAIKYLEESLELAKDGKEIRRDIDLIKPVNHSVDYEQITFMLEMTSDKIISLSSQEFSMFIMDNWSWKGQFEAMNASYGIE